jgi:hypothetical protein
MTFWRAFRMTYVEAWRFMVAAPLIAAAAIGVEGLQHLVEWRHGMYDSWAGMRAAGHDPSRMAAGGLKVLWITVLGYWVIRFVVSGGSYRATVAYDRIALRKFAGFAAFFLCLLPLTLFLPNLLQAAGVAPRTAAWAGLWSEVSSLVLGVWVIPWAVGAAAGDERAGPMFALRRAWGSVLWGLALSLATTIPPMAVHYALGYGAVGRAPALATALLAVDAVFVSFLAVALTTSQVMIAERMAQRAGEALLRPPIGPPIGYDSLESALGGAKP